MWITASYTHFYAPVAAALLSLHATISRTLPHEI